MKFILIILIKLTEFILLFEPIWFVITLKDCFFFCPKPFQGTIYVIYHHTGIFSFILAYQRFVNVCKPMDVQTLLSPTRKYLQSILVTVLFIAVSVSDATQRYYMGDWFCDRGPAIGDLQGLFSPLPSNHFFPHFNWSIFLNILMTYSCLIYQICVPFSLQSCSKNLLLDQKSNSEI